jgi:transcriptional/translational regulatory protein YebC/TACO1
LEDLGIPDLTSEQAEKLCIVAEIAARKYVFSKLPSKRIERLNVSAKAEGTKPVNLEINVDVILSPAMENSEAQKLVNDAIRKGFKSAEAYLRGLACHSQK